MSNRKTSRSDVSKSGASKRGGNVAAGGDGFRPGERLRYLQKVTTREKNTVYERLTTQSRIAMSGFLANKENNPRALVPLHEKHRVKITLAGKEREEHYVPAQYVVCERDEYILMQAPTKDNYNYFWKAVWQEGIKLIISVSDAFSDSDDNKCYPYFSTTPGETLSIQNDRFKVKTLSKACPPKDIKQVTVYELSLSSTLESDAPLAAKQDVSIEKKDLTSKEQDEEGDGKTRAITLLHIEDWDHETWHDLDTLAHFMKLILQKENQIIRKSLDTYVPPVMIQGHDAIGRCGVVWVAAILQKDIEKKESFDVEDLIKKFSRFRPGGFSKPVHLFQSFALSFRAASLAGWMSPEDAKKQYQAIQRAYVSTQRLEKSRRDK